MLRYSNMNTIIPAKESVKKLWRVPQKKDCEFRMMKYVMRLETENRTLLHNVITGEMLAVKVEDRPIIAAEEIKESDYVYNELIQKHFLVPDNYNEKELVEQLRNALRILNRNLSITNYVIYTTTNCNARCFYCYESNCKHMDMNFQTADSLVQFMCEHAKGNTVDIQWFGGEPLVNAQIISYICNQLKDKNQPFRSRMISNGFLINEELVQLFIDEWNLKQVQITLDGTEEVYNRTKAYIDNSESAFKKVMGNIDLLLQKGIKVVIRLNIDKHNADDLENLIEILSQKYANIDLLEVYSRIVYDGEGFRPILRSASDKMELAERKRKIEQLICDKFLKRDIQKLPGLRLHSCLADSDNSVVVYPDGNLFKCEHVNKSENIGSLIKGIDAPEIIEYWKRYSYSSRCFDCEILPSCINLDHCNGSETEDAIVSCDLLRQSYKKCMLDIYNRMER